MKYCIAHDGWNVTGDQGLFCPLNKPSCDLWLWCVCTIGKSWWPGGVRSQKKWTLLPRKLRRFLTFSSVFKLITMLRIISPKPLPSKSLSSISQFSTSIPSTFHWPVCLFVLSSVAWRARSTAKDFICTRLPVTSCLFTNKNAVPASVHTLKMGHLTSHSVLKKKQLLGGGRVFQPSWTIQ